MFRPLLVFTSVILCIGGSVFAQEQPNPDELNRKYQDALNQLKAAQDRKNELATENEKLKERIAELEKQNQEMIRAALTYADQTYFYRTQYAAWQNFIKRYPELMVRWRVFLESDPLSIPWHVPDPLEAESFATEKLPKSTDAK